MISVKKMQNDIRQEPQYGERVPYLVVHRGLKDRLIDCVVSLEEFFADKYSILKSYLISRSLRINGNYYITKQIIPALSRIFSLIDINVSNWYIEMPKRNYSLDFLDIQKNYKTIDQYYTPKNCICCRRPTELGKNAVI